MNITRLVKSFIYATRGIKNVFLEEQNFKIQSVFGFLVIVLGAILKINYTDWAIVIVAITFLLTAEAINSAVERLADAVNPRMDNYVKEIKDIMSAAVFLASFAALAVVIIIFGSRLR
jgi:diacylglycerol kinase